MKFYEIQEHGRKWSITFSRETYQYNGGLAIMVWNKSDETVNGKEALEPFAMLTVNLPQYGTPPEGQAFFNANNCSTKLLELVEREEIGRRTGPVAMSGYCEYPLMEFDLKKIEKGETLRKKFYIFQ